MACALSVWKPTYSGPNCVGEVHLESSAWPYQHACSMHFQQIHNNVKGNIWYKLHCHRHLSLFSSHCTGSIYRNNRELTGMSSVHKSRVAHVLLVSVCISSGFLSFFQHLKEQTGILAMLTCSEVWVSVQQ